VAWLEEVENLPLSSGCGEGPKRKRRSEPSIRTSDRVLRERPMQEHTRQQPRAGGARERGTNSGRGGRGRRNAFAATPRRSQRSLAPACESEELEDTPRAGPSLHIATVPELRPPSTAKSQRSSTAQTVVLEQYKSQCDGRNEAKELGLQGIQVDAKENEGPHPIVTGEKQQHFAQTPWRKKDLPDLSDGCGNPQDDVSDIRSKRDLTVLCEVEDAETGAFLRSTYGYIDRSDFASCRKFGEQLVSAGTPGWIDGEYVISARENDEAALLKIESWLAARENEHGCGHGDQACGATPLDLKAGL